MFGSSKELDPAGLPIGFCAQNLYNFQTIVLRPRMLSKVSEMSGFGIEFGKLIRQRRGVEGLTQEMLAHEADIPKARISLLENGRVANPHARTVDALCVALDISNRDRMACHGGANIQLSSLLLQNLAMRFGSDNPDASEDELVSFLRSKALEWHEMRERLDEISATDERLKDFTAAASEAIDGGDFQKADIILQQAEQSHFEQVTAPAILQQSSLRLSRGRAALLSGDVDLAAEHFAAAAGYFDSFDAAQASRIRFECAELLRFFAYRYSNAAALHAADKLLTECLRVWSSDSDIQNWWKTKSALAGVSWRLSQFDEPEHSIQHLQNAERHYREVLDNSSPEQEPRAHAVASLDIANIYSARKFSASLREFETNLAKAIQLQEGALGFFTEESDPRAWGIVHHNLGCTNVEASKLIDDAELAKKHLVKAIDHLEKSFRVRNQNEHLQYWVASCRSLGEALICMSRRTQSEEQESYELKAIEVLTNAQSQISEKEHPHQWKELQDQLNRVGE